MSLQEEPVSEEVAMEMTKDEEEDQAVQTMASKEGTESKDVTEEVPTAITEEPNDPVGLSTAPTEAPTQSVSEKVGMKDTEEPKVEKELLSQESSACVSRGRGTRQSTRRSTRIRSAVNKNEGNGNINKRNDDDNDDKMDNVEHEMDKIDEDDDVTLPMLSLSQESRLLKREARLSAASVELHDESSGKSVKSKRMTTTSTSTSTATSAVKKTPSSRGRSRRALFKRPPSKAPASVARIHTSDRVYYRGQWFSKGDVVSCRDVYDECSDDDNEMIYYAQIRGFLVDQYCEKSCVISWLLPTLDSPERGFDASTFIIGPEEELPRRLECFDFVMHAPSDYFMHRNAPYPTDEPLADLVELVTTKGEPKIRAVKEEPKDSGARRTFNRQPRL